MRLLTPPSTLAQQKRSGYLLIAAAVAVTSALTALSVGDANPWTRLIPVFVVTGSMAAAGAQQVIAARRGRLRFDEKRRRRHFRAGYRAFWILVLLVGIGSRFELLEDGILSLWLGFLAFFASLAYDGRRD